MAKHRLRNSIRSIFGSHLDSENDEQLKGAKIGDFLYQDNVNPYIYFRCSRRVFCAVKYNGNNWPKINVKL